ncbi:DUF1489 family protein [Pacificimonas flava]|nr:DUF1489 family protein [Pacificimonas flava]MBB5280370.1 hypothetical protein [Pacificimonas flava]
MTKTAVQCAHLSVLEDRNRGRLHEYGGRAANPIFTRYRPKRADELVGGSLFWIIAHQLTVRQEILGFEERQTAKGTECCIWLDAEMVPVKPRRKRAHQGWRYLEDRNKPADMLGGPVDLGNMPQSLVRELAGLGLL